MRSVAPASRRGDIAKASAASSGHVCLPDAALQKGFMEVILRNFELPGAGMAPGIGRFRWEAGDFRKEKLRLPRRGTGLAARVLGRQSFPQAGNGQTTLTEKIHKHRIATT